MNAAAKFGVYLAVNNSMQQLGDTTMRECAHARTLAHAESLDGWPARDIIVSPQCHSQSDVNSVRGLSSRPTASARSVKGASMSREHVLPSRCTHTNVPGLPWPKANIFLPTMADDTSPRGVGMAGPSGSQLK